MTEELKRKAENFIIKRYKIAETYREDNEETRGYYEPDKDCVHNIEYTSYRVADITNAFNEFINKMEI